MTGRRFRIAAGPLLLLALAFQPAPASAQLGNFIDNLLGNNEAKPEAGGQAEPPAAQGAGKPAPKTAKDGKAPTAAVDKHTGAKSAAKPSPTPTGAKGAASSLQGAEPDVVIEKANAYFNSFQTLTGSFLQIGPDGRKIGGKLYLAKPGRLRFAYDEPSPLEVIADGTSVAVRDRKLNTQDLYFLSQTPLKFLIRDRIDLARDLNVTGVSNDPGGIRVSMEDASTLGGTSKIQLYFDAEMKTLNQWRITDPQGYLTTVQLSNLQKGKAVDAINFFIDYGRAEDKAALQQMKQQRSQADAQ